jgi:hypothetical protein
MTSPISFSKLPIIIEIAAKGQAKGDIFRHLSPITINSIMRKMPLRGRTIRFRDQFVYFLTGVIAGVEKAKKQFKEGDISFYASNGAMCFFMNDCDLSTPMNYLGRISSNLDILKNSAPGDVISVSQSK